MHEEELKIYESLGNTRSHVVILYDLNYSIFLQTDADKALPYFANSFEVLAHLWDANVIV